MDNSIPVTHLMLRVDDDIRDLFIKNTVNFREPCLYVKIYSIYLELLG